MGLKNRENCQDKTLTEVMEKTVSPKAYVNWEGTVSNDHIWEAGQERTVFDGDKKPPEQEPWNSHGQTLPIIH